MLTSSSDYNCGTGEIKFQVQSVHIYNYVIVNIKKMCSFKNTYM